MALHAHSLANACPQPAEADSWPLEGLRKVDAAPQSAANQSGMQRFESCHPSQPVWSPRVKLPRRRKTTPCAAFSGYGFGLGVGIWAVKASFRRLVSQATFWCLIPASHGRRCHRSGF